jgi:hypothetical protein
MKRALILGIIGVGAGAASSYGQGLVNFNNYGNSSSPTIKYAASNVPGGKANLTLGGSFAAELGFYDGVASSSGQLTWEAATITYFGIDNGPGMNPDPDGAKYTGWFSGPIANLQSYGWSSSQAGQTVTIGVEAFNNGSYASASVRGFSGLIDIGEVSDAASAGWSIAPTPGIVGTAGANFTVMNVPEPTIMALGGLGLAGLLMAQKKKNEEGKKKKKKKATKERLHRN